MVDIYLVVTEHHLMMLKTDTKIKNVAKLLAWASLPSLSKINHSLTANDQISMYFRKVDGRKPWVLNVLMNQNSNECISMIVKNLKRENVTIKKEFEKKRMIMENEVNKDAMKVMKIDSVLLTIDEYEEKLKKEVSPSTAKHLIALYNKAVEYYSALNDDRHLQYLVKLQKLFADEKFSAAMEVSDVGTVDPQSNSSNKGDGSTLDGSIQQEESKEERKHQFEEEEKTTSIN